jgi:hypothetical protein
MISIHATVTTDAGLKAMLVMITGEAGTPLCKNEKQRCMTHKYFECRRRSNSTLSIRSSPHTAGRTRTCA